jgi:imidazolonepropionase-like amidohydrolase
MKLAAAVLVTALVHANVVDVRDGSIARDVTVTIEGNRIASIAPGVRPPKGATVVDATGKYVIPGLWDMHVHWYEESYLPLFVANGVTGVRQMWGFGMLQQWRDRIEAGTLVGPRQWIASAILDGPHPIWPGSVAVADADAGRAAVRDAKAAGFDFIKVYSLLPRDAFFAIAEQAKAEHMRFAGHVPFSVSSAEAADAGMQSIEHLTGVLLATSSHEEAIRKAYATADGVAAMMKVGRATADELLATYDETKAAALFARFVKDGTWQSPTLVVNRSIASLDDPAFADDARLRYVPQSYREMWNPKNDFRLKDLKPEDYAMRRKTFAKQEQIVGAMNKAGVRFVAGTDVGNPFCFPGFSLHDELALLVEAGLSPLQSLQAATRNAAELVGRDDLGVVEKGKLADLVVLDANPLVDIHNTTKIAAVVFDGRYHSRDELAKMLAGVEKLAARKSIVGPLLSTIDEKGVAAAIEQYRQWKKSEPEVWNFDEGDLNGLGYRLLTMKKFRDAIAIFTLETETFPDSADAYASLGEAYLGVDEKEQAIAAYKKALALDPKNLDAAAKLESLGAH